MMLASSERGAFLKNVHNMKVSTCSGNGSSSAVDADFVNVLASQLHAVDMHS